MFRKRNVLPILMSSILLITTTGVHAALVSNFDNGLEGWTGTGGTVSHNSLGGNPNGFLQQTDTAGNWMTVYAPPKFLGDLSSFLGETISFDAKNLSGVAANLGSAPWFGTITITGSNATASLEIAGSGPGQPSNDDSWHSYSAKLEPALWAGDLVVALSDVSELSVTLEFSDLIVESAGFDNFQIVPLPTALPMFFSAVVLLGLVRSRYRNKA